MEKDAWQLQVVTTMFECVLIIQIYAKLCANPRTQLWKVEAKGEEREITYLTTLVKHTCSVNVVRWCPTGIHPMFV